MKLVYPEYRHQIVFNENKIQVLIIENPTIFRNIVHDIYEQCNELSDGKAVLSDDDKIVKLSKAAYICINPFELDINSRKIITKLYTELKTLAYDEDMYISTNTIISQILQYCENIASRVDYDVEYDSDIDINGLLKIAGIRISNSDNESILEKIANYIDVMQRLMNMELAIFINFKNYLSKEEIMQLYELVNYRKTKLLLIESHDEEPIENEEKYIIDKDGCEIYY